METSWAIQSPLSAAGAAANAPSSLDLLRQQCRGMVRRRAALASLAAFFPLPGVGLITDVAVLMSVVDEITRRFGLAEAQIAALSPARQALIYRLTTSAGGLLAAKLSKSGMLMILLRRGGLRLGIMEASRFAPLVGQAIAALIAYFTLTHMARRHIEQCAEVAARLNQNPAPDASP